MLENRVFQKRVTHLKIQKNALEYKLKMAWLAAHNNTAIETSWEATAEYDYGNL